MAELEADGVTVTIDMPGAGKLTGLFHKHPEATQLKQWRVDRHACRISNQRRWVVPRGGGA